MVAAVTPDNMEYYTPKKILDEIIYPVLGDPIGIDPCGNPHRFGDINALEIFRFTDKDGCGLTKPWFDYDDPMPKIAFVNPPYGRDITKWVKKSILETGKAWAKVKKGTAIILLVPVKTDTKWWNDLMFQADIWYGFEGRIKFDRPIYDDNGAFCGIKESSGNGTFASALVLLTLDPEIEGKFRWACHRSSFDGIMYQKKTGPTYDVTRTIG